VQRTDTKYFYRTSTLQHPRTKRKFSLCSGYPHHTTYRLKKALEALNLEPEAFLKKILDLMGINFSYLTQDDIPAEKTWP
jgi:predicted transcriptional regulator